MIKFSKITQENYKKVKTNKQNISKVLTMLPKIISTLGGTRALVIMRQKDVSSPTPNGDYDVQYSDCCNKGG